MSTRTSADTLDYRVMLARAIDWARMPDGGRLTPAYCAEIDRMAYDGEGTTLREQIEEWCGEALA
jgi:hypothetical protein